MGSSSGSTHRGLVHWQELLLVVSLLNFWSQPITAHVKVESIDALERMDAILRVHNKPHNAVAFLWYRGRHIDIHNNIAYLFVNPSSHVRGPPGGKVMVKNDGSLLLKYVTMKDAGIYTLLVQLQGCQKMIACGRLNVYAPVRVPTLIASNTRVTENKDSVVMSCYTNNEDIEWFFKGKSLILTERTKLSLDLRNLTIDPVLRRDAGYYECKASNPLTSGKSARLNLDVQFE